MGKLFKDLQAGFKEALAHEKGKIHLRSISIEIPEPPSEYKPIDADQGMLHCVFWKL